MNTDLTNISPATYDFMKLLVLKGRLSLELKGMKSKGRTAYSLAKERYNLSGNRQKVLSLLDDMIKCHS